MELSVSKQILLGMIKLRIHGATIPYCVRQKNQTSEKELGTRIGSTIA